MYIAISILCAAHTVCTLCVLLYTPPTFPASIFTKKCTQKCRFSYRHSHSRGRLAGGSRGVTLVVHGPARDRGQPGRSNGLMLY